MYIKGASPRKIDYCLPKIVVMETSMADPMSDLDLVFNDDDFARLLNESLDDTNAEEDAVNYRLCINCKIDMLPDINNAMYCSKCGLVQKCITDNSNYEPSMNGYNTNGNHHIPIRCVGKNSFKYQKQLRITTSQYSVVQEANLKRQLNSRNNNSSDLMIPKSVVASALEQYKLIRKTSKIHRGDVLKGILAAIIYYECLKRSIVRKPKEICEWYGITENDLSKGDKILRNLEEAKIVTLPINDDNDDKYVSSYLKRMGMSEEYEGLMLEILGRLEKLRIGNPNARLSTKVAALIFLVVVSKGIPKQADDISEEFKIAVATFKLFYNEIVKKKELIQDILDKYCITIPDKLPRKRRK